MSSEYPDGKCRYCGKVFERPHKFKTEKDGKHEKQCELKYLKERLKEDLDSFDKMMILKDLESLSHRCSFGAKEGNDYYNMMLEIKKLKDEVRE